MSGMPGYKGTLYNCHVTYVHPVQLATGVVELLGEPTLITSLLLGFPLYSNWF